MLTKGSTDAAVWELQRLLVSNGYILKEDGIFDSKTDAAVRDFQHNNELVADGIVGPQTWAVLKKNSYLKDNAILNATPTNPEIPLENPNKEILIDIYNRWGQLITAAANILNIEPATLLAVVAVESGGQAFTTHGMIIRFENHTFSRQPGVDKEWFKQNFTYDLKQPWTGHMRKTASGWEHSHIWPTTGMEGAQESEWTSFHLAASHNRKAALNSISMGLPQIMGFNSRIIGYNTTEEMFEAFNKAAHPQLLGMFDFIVGPNQGHPMLEALRNRDFFAFARSYNGPSNASKYSQLIHDKYAKAKEVLNASIT